MWITSESIVNTGFFIQNKCLPMCKFCTWVCANSAHQELYLYELKPINYIQSIYPIEKMDRWIDGNTKKLYKG